MAQQLTQQEQQQLDELSRSFTAGGAADALAVDVCGIWKRIKPYWWIIVKAVGLIPKVGPAIAAILQALGAGLDESSSSCCRSCCADRRPSGWRDTTP